MTWQEADATRSLTGVSIPTLAEVLTTAPPSATVYVEIKGAGIETLVAEVIGRSSARCAVHSFDHAAVERFRKIAPDVPRGVLFERETDKLEAEVRRVGARDVWPHYSLIDTSLVELVHALGGRVIAWTVNDVVEAKRLAALGVAGICTDDVRILDGIG